jgi:hypothetical protein
MNHSWLKTTVVYVFPLGILGLALGLFVRSLRYGNTEAVAVEPKLAEIAVDPLQYQAVTVHLQLINRSGKAIRIRKAETSCGCASLVTRGGKTLVEPMNVLPGDTVPWQVEIHTVGRLGPNEFKVHFEVESEGRTSHALSTIKMNVHPAILVHPHLIEFQNIAPGEQRNATVVLSDRYPDSGYSVKHLRSSDPERIQVQVVAPEKDTPVGAADAEGNAANLRPRWCIKVRYVAPSSPRALIQDTIVLEPNGKLLPQISIPVICTMMPPDYELSPPSLVLPADSRGRTVQRTIRCRVRPGTNAALQVLSAPRTAKVTFVPLDEQTQDLQIALEVPRDPADISTLEPIRIGSGHRPSPAFSIPIEFIRLK